MLTYITFGKIVKASESVVCMVQFGKVPHHMNQQILGKLRTYIFYLFNFRNLVYFYARYFDLLMANIFPSTNEENHF